MATKIEVAFLEEGHLGAWDALVERAPGGTLFHRSAWVRLLAEPFGRRARVLGVFRNGALVGGCPVYERRRLGLMLAKPPVLAGYAGALVDLPEYRRSGRATSESEQVLEALEKELRRCYDAVRLVNDPGFQDARPFQWGGWRATPRYTYRISGVPPGSILDTFEHNVRKKIRKAEEGGLSVHRVEVLDEVLGCYAASYQRHGTRPPVPQAVLKTVAEGVLAAGLGRAHVVRGPVGGSYAFQIDLEDDRTSYAWVAGSDPSHLTEGSFPLLIRHVVARVLESGRAFDFLGANTRSIAGFKRAFGGQLVPYVEVEYAGLPARFLLAARRLARR